MSTEVSTDASGLVDEAFDEMRCEGLRPIPHEGKISALLVGHGCVDQLLCAAHLKLFIEIKVPEIRAYLDQYEFVRCDQCHGFFGSVDEFVKVYPL